MEINEQTISNSMMRIGEQLHLKCECTQGETKGFKWKEVNYSTFEPNQTIFFFVDWVPLFKKTKNEFSHVNKLCTHVRARR